MPEKFDPAWEYRTVDPEIEELFSERELGWVESGFRFGTGDPNQSFFRYGGKRERPLLARPTERRKPKNKGQKNEKLNVCVGCGDVFRSVPRPFCCARCLDELLVRRGGVPLGHDGRINNGRKRVLPDVVCPCGKKFRSTRSTDVYCSIRCFGVSCRRTQTHDTGCPNCGKEVVPSGKGRSAAKVYCNRSCKHTLLQRRTRDRNRR